jgi:hypothetical protein
MIAPSPRCLAVALEPLGLVDSTSDVVHGSRLEIDFEVRHSVRRAVCTNSVMPRCASLQETVRAVCRVGG